MAYTSNNQNFLVELEKKYKESIYYVYYIIKWGPHRPIMYDTILKSDKEWIVGKPSRKMALLCLEYLDSLNSMIAMILKKDNQKLSPNATLSEVTEFFELTPLEYDRSKHWGNYMWSFLHYTSIYMNIMKDNSTLYDLFYNVIFNLRIILPGCNACSLNYQSKLERGKNDPSDKVTIKDTILVLAKTDAIKAIYDLHTLVNQHTNYIKYKDYTFENYLTAYDLIAVLE
jgi:hypothetical protein